MCLITHPSTLVFAVTAQSQVACGIPDVDPGTVNNYVGGTPATSDADNFGFVVLGAALLVICQIIWAFADKHGCA